MAKWLYSKVLYICITQKMPFDFRIYWGYIVSPFVCKADGQEYSSVKIKMHIWAAAQQNQQNDQWRLRSAWASAQTDQSLYYPYEEISGPFATHRSDWVDAQADLSLR